MVERTLLGCYRLLAFLLMFMLTLGLSCIPARAQVELIESVAILEDKSASALLQDVFIENFAQSDRSINLGYSASAYWIKMRIIPSPDDSSVVLIVNPHMLDEVALFAPIEIHSEESAIHVNGKPYMMKDNTVGLNPRTYILSPPIGGADYLLRIASLGSLSLNLSAQSSEDAMRTINSAHLSQHIYLGLLIFLLTWSILVFLLIKEPLLLYFVPLLSLWIVHNMFSFGYFSSTFSSYNINDYGIIFRHIAIILSIILLMFHRALLLQFQPANLAIRLIDAHILFGTALLLAFATLTTHMPLQVNAYLIAISPISLLITAMTATRDGFVGLNNIKVFYTIILILNATWATQLLGLNFDSIESFNGPMAYGTSTSFLIFIITAKYSLEAYRSQKRNKDRIYEFQQKDIIELEKRKSMVILIDMLAHETKNALSIISMTVSATDLGAERKNRIYRAISGLNSVIERCDQSVRLYNIDERLKIQKCDLSEIINNIIEDQIEKFRITVEKIAQPTILADPVFLNVILYNLLENALKYSPAGSKVTITLDEQQGEAILTFENEQGTSGMPDPELVFQRHYRNERAQGISGSGLGLYICARLARAQNGNIYYRPSENHVRFIVSLPCAI